MFYGQGKFNIFILGRGESSLPSPLATRLKSAIICVYSIAEHGKGDVIHVGRFVKTSIWREIAGEEVLLDLDHMVSFNFAIMKIPIIWLKKLKKVIFKSRDNTKDTILCKMNPRS